MRDLSAALAPPASAAADDSVAGRALAIGIVALCIVYVALYVAGARFFMMKTAVMPVFLVYALLLRRRVAFVTDWLPLLAGTVLFDATRGAIFVAVKRGLIEARAGYVITLEQLAVGTPAAPLALQSWRTPLFDHLAVLLHASHFPFFLLFGLVVWHAHRDQFDRFRRALLLVMAVGLVGYAAIPTVPPWLAYEPLGLLPPITRVIAQVYTSFIPDIYGLLDTNPVAAMPSLHAAFPVVCAFIGWATYGRRAGIGILVYALGVMVAIVYLGEHYVVDILAGVILALWALRLSRLHLFRSWSFTRSLVVSASAIALTFALLYVAH